MRTRLGARASALAGAIALCTAATAHADISGLVTDASGGALPGISVRSTEADGTSGPSATTDAIGRYTVRTSSCTAPFSVTARYHDSCRDADQERTAAAAGLATNATAPTLVLDPYELCGASTPAGSPAATGNVRTERGQVPARRAGSPTCACSRRSARRGSP
ncbi:carboxypeptidase-like regulatory domain-containing protein [Miltoncostaea marina]|uniref:carboxypeptidase-like regulatory domain-containing protein n=1 Tax=Miltoncostaea marina TaxID=2843215 RepID=UPI001C3DDE7B|nr:carboxypeptidase-like regulatory domain-containing protein [Miltoncostaea marina]